jgi:hypothetical protein
MLLLGVVLLGGGMLAVSPSTNVLSVAPALIAAALGFGLVNTVAFPLFSTLIPDGESGGYTALFFSIRAVASAIACRPRASSSRYVPRTLRVRRRCDADRARAAQRRPAGSQPHDPTNASPAGVDEFAGSAQSHW